MTKICVVNTSDRMFFQLCQSIFSMNDIPYQIKSTMDSMYNSFGTFEIYVAEENKDLALDLIENHENTPHA